MSDLELSTADGEQIQAHGSSVEQLAAMVDKLRRPPTYVQLIKAAGREDGVCELDVDRLAPRVQELQVVPGKFTPMSGAASRMFGFMDRLLSAAPKDGDAQKTTQLLAGLDAQGAGARFAFIESLRQCLANAGQDLEQLRQKDEKSNIIKYILDDTGLGLRRKPKALIPFHLRDGSPVLPLEEHLREALGYAGKRLHCTISPEHADWYDAALQQIRAQSPELAEVQVELSVQHPSTDSVAIDADSGALVRDAQGRIAFFPAGHGSLLKNIDALDRPVVLRNVDNVPKPAAAQLLIARYHQAMAVLLHDIKRLVGQALGALEAGTATAEQLKIWLGTLRRWHVNVLLDQQRFDAALLDEQRSLLREALDRPVKIVGVVPNQGEPGGGPFVIDFGGLRVLSIVEKDEIADEQRHLMRDGAFFNPVDILIDPTDHNGRPYELDRFVNDARHFIVRKPYQGREVVRLEHPGLWNGAMEGWTSVFVVLPIETFAPVKEVIDLLRPEHQLD